jgi:hypothetical protein
MIHAEVDPVLTLDSQSGVCGTCHGDLIAAQDKQSVHDFDGGDMNCSSCHNPHADADIVNCSNCHQQDEATIARQPPKARDFHRTGLTNKLSCVRCHRGIAHGLPGWVEDIKKSQQQYND